MFTGIIRSTGALLRIEPRGGDLHLHVGAGGLDLAHASVGDSIAVNGVCLTAVALAADSFCADVSPETLRCTTLGALREGERVNLEPALRAGDPLGGHLVSGHVDGVGEVVSLEEQARARRVEIEAPAALARYIAQKGSICVDGVSLTINHVDEARFCVQIVPHTWEATTFADYAPGRRVNLEVDLLARYLERLLQERGP